MFRYLLIFFCINAILVTSCTKPIELNLSKQAPRLVVEGSVYSAPGPYFIHLTLSRNALSSRSNVDDVTPVKNATVIISDNVGNIDTLVAPPDSIYGYAKLCRREGDQLNQEQITPVRFVPLIGQEGWPDDQKKR